MRFDVDPELDEPTREALTRLWTQVTNAGGAVGFVAPVTHEQVRALAEPTFERVRAGDSHLVVACEGERPIGFGLLEGREGPLFAHWTEVKRLQVAPDRQGGGRGRLLLGRLHELAADLGLEQTRVTVRGGTGLEAFYESVGYEIDARVPDTVRVAPGDDREEIILIRRLHPS